MAATDAEVLGEAIRSMETLTASHEGSEAARLARLEEMIEALQGSVVTIGTILRKHIEESENH